MRHERTRIVITNEFSDRRKNGHLNGLVIRGHIGNDIQNRTEGLGHGSRDDQIDRGLVHVVSNATTAESAAAASTALSTATAAAALIVQTRGNGADIGHFDVSLTTAKGRDFRSGEKIHAVALFQRADDHLELRIGQDAGEAEHLRDFAAVRGCVTQTRGDQLVVRARSGQTGYAGAGEHAAGQNLRAIDRGAAGIGPRGLTRVARGTTAREPKATTA